MVANCKKNILPPAPSATDAPSGASCSAAAADGMPAAVMRELAAFFTQRLQMTNGCVPGSLLLWEVLAARGVACRLRSGFLVVKLGRELPRNISLPPEIATSHMWVEVEVEDGCGGSPTVLDIGMALAEAAGMGQAAGVDIQRYAQLPAGVQCVAEESDGIGKPVAPAAVAILADSSADRTAYWAGAPPVLRSFRKAMLQHFALRQASKAPGAGSLIISMICPLPGHWWRGLSANICVR